MRKCFDLALIFLSSILLQANEFWLYPDKFIYKRGEVINIRLMSGENFEGENWNGDKTNVQSIHFYFGGVKDSCNSILSENKGDSLQIAMYDEGTAILTFNTKNSFMELEAEKFNTGLERDGLNKVIEYRKQHNDTNQNGKEYYQRSIKTILQVGNKTDKTYKQETDLPIDIIPEEHPYSIAKDGNFKLKVLFRRQPLAHTKVKVWHRLNDKLTQLDYYTDEKGEIKFFLAPIGRWMVSVVEMEHLENDPKADWQSYQGSLTWGYD